ncbi:MAG: tetratricopeptide repeat protein [Burkholderiales bacterium]|nr:tetratricopeptide repeat protein [Anaerolineae bacterium]
MKGHSRSRKIAFGMTLIVLTLALVACGVNAAERNNAGNSMYSQQDYDGALQAYYAAQVAEPDLPVPYYNAAGPLSEQGDLDAARASLEQALTSADETLAQQAYYNLGNVYFDMAMYPEAITAYQNALLRRPDDEDARYNLELALSRLPTSTPPPQEQETEPTQDEPDSTPTPTQAPQSQQLPTPTPNTPTTQPDVPPPPPSPEEGEDGDEPGDSLAPEAGGPMSIEAAEQLLDAVQQDQQTLREYLQGQATPANSPEEDW